MKKVLVILLSVMAFNVYAFADTPVTFAQLPQKAQQFINKHFSNVGFLSAKQDDGEYEVMLKDGTKIDFTLQGDWKDVDCHVRAVPAAIVPASITNYVKTNFSSNIITKIEKNYNGYDIELETDLELKFDKNGKFMYADD
ncbi:MAG: PepSY-like domain-containing protein [Bacteroidales bacterium]|jgi:hypothetical protein|nr:PepSY-like domain-containing protein [Bacteroidales bacterium]